MPYYVSMIRSAAQRALLDGPFDTHEAALAAVPAARRWASERDAWTDFDAFGTCQIAGPVPVPLMRRDDGDVIDRIADGLRLRGFRVDIDYHYHHIYVDDAQQVRFEVAIELGLETLIERLRS